MENLVGKVVKILPCALGVAKHYIGETVIIESENEDNASTSINNSKLYLVKYPRDFYQREFELQSR